LWRALSIFTSAIQAAFRGAKGDIEMLGNVFDPRAETQIYEHCRPHWSQAGAVVFITFRTYDSIPLEVMKRWDREKELWLDTRGYDTSRGLEIAATALTPVDRFQFQKAFNRCREDFLDSCYGRCLLKWPEIAKIVADSLLHFDGTRYRMGDFVIMPNHVHLLAVFPSAEAMNDQSDSWLHYTAFRINQIIGEKGKFWQQEPFDHLVRSPEQYEYLRLYIADNPQRARLKEGEYLYRRLNE
jgi:type I restriction enzyme R subunit